MPKSLDKTHIAVVKRALKCFDRWISVLKNRNSEGQKKSPRTTAVDKVENCYRNLKSERLKLAACEPRKRDNSNLDEEGKSL